MRRILKIIFVLIPVMLSASPSSGTDCSSCAIYKGFIAGDMQLWGKGIKELQDLYNREPAACTMYTLTEARYGYAGFLLGTGNKDVAKSAIDAFEKDIELLAGYPGYRAETEAFRVALLGFRMGLNPAKAVTLGPKALKQLEVALEAGGNNPAVWIEKANSEANMPAFAGGSNEKAAASFREALRLYETDRGLSDCNWRYLNTIVQLGQLLEEMKDLKGAREAYLRALKRAPDFQWVKDELLPALEKKIK